MMTHDLESRIQENEWVPGALKIAGNKLDLLIDHYQASPLVIKHWD